MSMGLIDKSLLPLLAMVSVQVIHASVNLLSKVALDSGMKPYVFVTYRQILAAVAITPFAIFLERNTWPQNTRRILLLSLLCSVFGATMQQLLYFYGLRHSTPIISVATVNTLPALTFIIAVIFRQENAMIRKRSGQAKIVGTCVCVGGAFLLVFYHGRFLTKSQSHIHVHIAGNKTAAAVKPSALGALLIILSRVSSAFWLIIQTELSRIFPAPFTNTMLLCLFSSIQCAVISVIINHNRSAWSISCGIQLAAVLYAGVISSGVGFLLVSWTAGKKGPLYVSIFGPLSLVIVAILGWAVMDEKLYWGTLYGSLLIMVGLYMVLWGKSREQPQAEVRTEETHCELEMPNAVIITVANKEGEEKQ